MGAQRGHWDDPRFPRPKLLFVCAQKDTPLLPLTFLESKMGNQFKNMYRQASLFHFPAVFTL